MNAKQKRWYQAAGKRQMMAGLLCGLFLCVLALAQFETLHRWLHAQASQPGHQHQCAVTMVQSGQVESSLCAEFVVVPPVGVVADQPVKNFFIPSVDYSLLPSRGPPASLT